MLRIACFVLSIADGAFWFSRRSLWIGLILGGLIAFVGVRPVAAEEVVEGVYWELVEDSIAVLSREDVSGAELRGLAERWDRITAVRLDDHTLVPLNTGEIEALLLDEEVDPAAVVDRLRAMLIARQDWPEASWDEGAATTAQAQLTEILARPEFQEAQPTFVQELWSQFWQRVDEIVDWILPQRGGEGVLGLNVVGIGIAIVGGVVILAVLALVIRSLVSDFVAEADYESEWGVGNERLTSAGALEEAQKLSSGGDYRTAVRYLYLSCLLSLEERGLLRYDRSLTNREYLRSVAHRPELFGLLKDVVDVFDRVWYGFMPIDAQTYAQYAERVTALQQQRVARLRPEEEA